MKIKICDRCGKQLELWEGVKIKITSFYDGAISKKHLCDDCFKDFQDFYYRKDNSNEKGNV